MNQWIVDSFRIVATPEAYLFDHPGHGEEPPAEAQSDVLLSGWAVRRTGETSEGWDFIQTHYGYTGWIRQRDLREFSREALQARQNQGNWLRVLTPSLDLHGEPTVHGALLETLPKNALVEILQEEPRDHWRKVRSGSGTEGWTPEASLIRRADDDTFLLQPADDPAWFGQQAGQRVRTTGEETLRAGAVQSALRYLGTQYRWGGKSPWGIDCSGLVFMSWLEQGILIYRDADLRPGYPMHSISREALLPGDLIFFPGHVAMALGEGKYIHATAYARTPWVTVNSLNPADPDYREDLAAKITACGSLFGAEA